MNKQTYPIPEGCKAISMEIIDNAIVTTFEPEKQPEFKKGDIVFGEYKGNEIVLILDSILEFSYIARYSVTHNRVNSTPSTFSSLFNLRLATETQKQLLFDALVKENKMWDSEKMEIVELKYIPKVGDCVKVYRTVNEEWTAYFHVVDIKDGLFSFKSQIASNTVYIFKDLKQWVVGNNSVFTKITPEELQSKFNRLGYEYDFETHEAKKLRWKPKMSENYYYLDSDGIVIDSVGANWSSDLARYNYGNCFKTEAEAQKFKDYILKYEAQNN